ncbi:MAG: hypothetical protein WDN24_10660 [Sphingomonas sp.]
MGDFWGAVYGGGAYVATGGNIGAAAATDALIDHTVTEGTGPMCHLGDAFFAEDHDSGGAADCGSGGCDSASDAGSSD